MQRLSGRIEVLYTLLSPLSHIGESHGPDSYLATQEIVGPDGRPVEVFVYSGNAVRGMLRDHGAQYMLERLGQGAAVQVPLDVFHLLFSGGSIGGDQSIDIDQARRIREAVPLISLLGGGVGNQLLPGKLRVGPAWPLCAETQHLLPERLRDPKAVSWRVMTTELSMTRKDDSKDERLRPYLIPDDRPALQPGEQASLALSAGDEGPSAEKGGGNGKKDRPQQMRYTVECLAAGARLWQRIDVVDATMVEFGALVSALVSWSEAPYLGGMSRAGLGRVEATWTWHPRGGESEPLALVGDAPLELGPTAREAKQTYDQYLDQYVRYLDEGRERLVRLLAAGA